MEKVAEASPANNLRKLFTTYAEALEVCGLSSLHDRREYLTTKLFHEICRDPDNKLYNIFLLIL
jgi:hypothetical protein